MLDLHSHIIPCMAPHPRPREGARTLERYLHGLKPCSEGPAAHPASGPHGIQVVPSMPRHQNLLTAHPSPCPPLSVHRLATTSSFLPLASNKSPPSWHSNFRATPPQFLPQSKTPAHCFATSGPLNLHFAWPGPPAAPRSKSTPTKAPPACTSSVFLPSAMEAGMLQALERGDGRGV